MTVIESQYAKQIDMYIKQGGAESELGKAPLVIAGTKKMAQVYRLPTSLLAFNIRNGRFAFELKQKQAELGRTLDPRDPDDAVILQQLLLTQDENATRALRDDLKQVGQTDPGIITHDGFVVNANRRMAILMELHKEMPTGKFQYLEVMRLPPDISEKDLWRIEAGIQLSRDKRLVYGPINDLLKIREGLEAGLSPQEIAVSLYGASGPDEITEKDARLSLIDSFLQYIEEPNAYDVVENKVEHFINLQNILHWLEEKQGVKPKALHAMLLRAFELIRTPRIGHMDIRALRQIYDTEAAREFFLEGLAPFAGKLPREKRDAHVETQIRDVLKTSREIVELEKESLHPQKLLERANRTLDTLLKNCAAIAAEPTLHQEVRGLEAKVQELVRECATASGKKGARGKPAETRGRKSTRRPRA